MLVDLKMGQSYVWLLVLIRFIGVGAAVCVATWMGIFVGIGPFTILAAFAAFLLPLGWLALSEWRSGVALDRTGRAAYERGSPGFKRALAIRTGGLLLTFILVLVLSYERMQP
jgi:hypothetical protein